MKPIRLITALALGLIGAIIIWVFSPYNNFVLGNAFISDDFLPVAAIGMILPFILLINPLLHYFAPKFKLSFSQLALIFGIYLVACITPGQGGMRHIFYPLGATPASDRVIYLEDGKVISIKNRDEIQIDIGQMSEKKSQR